MKIITKDNFDRDIYQETVIAENVNEYNGKIIVELLNNKFWTESSDEYYALVEDDYELYDGYKHLM